MSWNDLNNFELQALRKVLGISVSEASNEIANLKTPRAWQKWEKGDHPIPEDVQTEMYAHLQWRTDLLIEYEIVLDEENKTKFESEHIARWFHTYDDFVAYFPQSPYKSFWRLHQSVIAELFGRGDVIELSDSVEIDKNSYMYKFFTKTREEDIENARMEKVFKDKGIDI